MTLSTILFTAAYLLAAVADVLPQREAMMASVAIAVAGKLGKALYELARAKNQPRAVQALYTNATTHSAMGGHVKWTVPTPPPSSDTPDAT